MNQIKKLCFMSKLVFLEKLAYTRALWIDIVSVMISILVYYFLWQVVFQKNSAPAGYTACTDDDLCDFIENACIPVYRRCE